MHGASSEESDHVLWLGSQLAHGESEHQQESAPQHSHSLLSLVTRKV